MVKVRDSLETSSSLAWCTQFYKITSEIPMICTNYLLNVLIWWVPEKDQMFVSIWSKTETSTDTTSLGYAKEEINVCLTQKFSPSKDEDYYSALLDWCKQCSHYLFCLCPNQVVRLTFIFYWNAIKKISFGENSSHVQNKDFVLLG